MLCGPVTPNRRAAADKPGVASGRFAHSLARAGGFRPERRGAGGECERRRATRAGPGPGRAVLEAGVASTVCSGGLIGGLAGSSRHDATGHSLVELGFLSGTWLCQVAGFAEGSARIGCHVRGGSIRCNGRSRWCGARTGPRRRRGWPRARRGAQGAPRRGVCARSRSCGCAAARRDGSSIPSPASGRPRR